MSTAKLSSYWIQVLWLLSIPIYLWAGTWPDRYAIDVLHTRPGYPLQGILTTIAITGIECFVLWALIRPTTYEKSWGRAACALLLYFPWLLLCGLMLMHQPLYVLVHFLWVLVLNLILLGLFLCSLVARAVSREQGRETNPALPPTQ